MNMYGINEVGINIILVDRVGQDTLVVSTFTDGRINGENVVLMAASNYQITPSR